MANLTLRFLYFLAFFSSNTGLTFALISSACGDWIPYKNEECVKLIATSGSQTKEDGEVICKALGEELHIDDTPKLITVKADDKQTFMQKLLFEELETLDTVWMGIDLERDGIFRWNDGTDLFYTNWVNETSLALMADRERNCVQMESGEGVYEIGKWVRANCKKRNAVVCERIQPWTVAALQNIVLSLKLEVKKNKLEADESKQEITNLKRNPVPMGFIYAQLPGQQPPTELWPQTSWKDIGQQYAGLFFRVEGGNAAPFGQEQRDNTRRIAEIGAVEIPQDNYNQIVPEDGSWSVPRWTGSSEGWKIGTYLRLTTGEIRPRNKSMKLWQRIG